MSQTLLGFVGFMAIICSAAWLHGECNNGCKKIVWSNAGNVQNPCLEYHPAKCFPGGRAYVVDGDTDDYCESDFGLVVHQFIVSGCTWTECTYSSTRTFVEMDSTSENPVANGVLGREGRCRLKEDS